MAKYRSRKPRPISASRNTDLVRRDKLDDEHKLYGQEHKIAKRVSAELVFVVSVAHKALLGTPNWLPLTKRIDLRLYAHDVDLPEVIDSSIDDPASERVIHVALADESKYDAPAETRRREYYVAHHENEPPLDIPDTETVIGILALIADETENVIR